MIYKYQMTGEVHGSGKKVTSFCSAPVGITSEEFFSRLSAFMLAFENVKATVN